jgi:hypothetical protein
MGQNLADNKMRIPRHASSLAREQLNRRSNMLSGQGEIKDASKPPRTVHPHCMYDPAFQDASAYDKRLDYLVDKRALPSCVLPESFEKGVAITECEGGNGVYFNKYAANEHVARILESSQYLATVPGIAGGNFAEGPASLQADRGARSEEDAVLDEVRKEERAKRKASASASEVGSDDAAEEKRQKTSAAAPMEADHEVDEASDAEFAEGSESEGGDPPEVRADASSSDLSSLKQGVERPEERADGVQPTAGAFDRAASASVAPSLKQETLPSLWDQGAIFYSYKMAETLHNDCEAYVDAVRAKYPDLYDREQREETFAKLPHITMRFPGITDAKEDGAPAATAQGAVSSKATLILPLSCPIPLKESRYCDVASQVRTVDSNPARPHTTAHNRTRRTAVRRDRERARNPHR